MKGAFCEAAAPSQVFILLLIRIEPDHISTLSAPERGSLSILFALSYGRLVAVGDVLQELPVSL